MNVGTTKDLIIKQRDSLIVAKFYLETAELDLRNCYLVSFCYEPEKLKQIEKYFDISSKASENDIWRRSDLLAKLPEYDFDKIEKEFYEAVRKQLAIAFANEFFINASICIDIFNKQRESRPYVKLCNMDTDRSGLPYQIKYRRNKAVAHYDEKMGDWDFYCEQGEIKRKFNQEVIPIEMFIKYIEWIQDSIKKINVQILELDPDWQSKDFSINNKDDKLTLKEE